MADAYVADAQRWAVALLDLERRASGRKMPDAMRSVEERLNLDHNALWALRYRPPRDIVASVYMRLKAAYEHEVERQEARLRHELLLTKAVVKDANTSNIVAEVEAFLASNTEGE